MAYHPNGATVASASGNKGLQIFDLQGRQLGAFRHPSYVRSVAFSPDGKCLASSCERKITVWDLNTGRERWSVTLLGELQAWRIPTRLAFSPDGTTVAAGNGSRDVGLLDAMTGQVRCICRGHRDTVVCTAYSPNGKFLVSGSFDHTLKVWDAATGRELKTLRGHRDWVFCAALARDGRTLASAGREGDVILWDIDSGRRLATLKAHSKEASCVTFSAQGNVLASSGVDGAVKFWDVSRIVKAP